MCMISDQGLHTNAETLCHPGEIPNRLNRKFRDCQLAGLIETNLSIRHKSTSVNALFQFWKFHVSFRNRNRRPNVDVLLMDYVLEQPRGEMAERIHRHDLLRISPLRERTNVGSWFSVSEVGFVFDIEILAGNSQSMIY